MTETTKQTTETRAEHTAGRLALTPDGVRLALAPDGVTLTTDYAGDHIDVRTGFERSEPDARRLALCWNTHDELVAACRALLDAQGRHRHPLGDPDEGIATICAEAASLARAALARANGEAVEP